jgi:hypothetical protein
MKKINKLVKNNLIRGLPRLNFVKDKVCSACELGKMTKISFKLKIEDL